MSISYEQFDILEDINAKLNVHLDALNALSDELNNLLCAIEDNDNQQDNQK